MPFKEHPLFVDPIGNNLKIFRYFNLTKFLFLIKNQSLFFVRVKELLKTDPWEGSYLQKELDFRIKDFVETEKRWGRVVTDESKKRHADMWRRGFEEKIRTTFVNCWNYGYTESFALWKLYASSEAGVAIKSSFDRLKKSFSNNREDVFIGEIKYMDYDKDIYNIKFHRNTSFNLFLPFLTKRNVFEFEQEYRAIVTQHDNKTEDAGINVSVDLNELVDEIYVAPYSPKWFKDLVEGLLIDYGFNYKVNYSIIDEPRRDFRI